MSRNRILISAAVAAAGLVTLAACSSSPAANPGASGESTTASGEQREVTLMLNFYAYGDHVPLYYGLQEGIFAENGIDLTIVAGAGSNLVAQAVGEGQVEFGIVDTPAVLTSVQAGVPIHSLGAFYEVSPAAVQYLSSSGIEEPADLAGRSIALTAGDPYSETFPALLEANGLSMDDLEVVNVQPAAKTSSVVSGQADALVGNTTDQGPTISNITGEDTGALLFADWGIATMGHSLTMSDAMFESDPELARAMFDAVSQSFVAALDNPEAAVASMEGADNPTLPPTEVIAEQWERAAPLVYVEGNTSGVPGANSQELWDESIALFAELGVLDEVRPASDFWNNMGEQE